jgi:uncharacterized membrane protein YphA (DoxX/SURF4 family)
LAAETEAGVSKPVDIFLWVCQLIGALAFSLVGVAKIVGADAEVQLFAAVGYGQWLRYFTGGLEIAGALMVVFPGTAAVGAFLLMGVMAGATVVHLTVLHTNPTLPLALMILMAIVAFGRQLGRHRIKARLATHSAH